MIINTGCRTDIPAYYSDWFYNRIKEGDVLTRNPYYPNQVTRFSLDLGVVDCIAFCTKNPGPMLARLEEISKYKQFWFVTINPYGKEIEPFVPDKDIIMNDFKELSRKVGINAIGWRYDPIFLTNKYTMEYHIYSFREMAEKLAGYTNQCVISFIDLYAKTKRNFPEGREVNQANQIFLAKAFVEIGKEFGIIIRSCHEGVELANYGVDVTGCMTQPIIEQAIQCKLQVPKSKKSPREACNCLLGNDIGEYNTCGHGCVYCYANYDRKTVEDKMKQHNPISAFLIGDSKPGDQIKNARQESYQKRQITLFE